MKRNLLLILLNFAAVTCFGQKISLTPVQNKGLKSILCDVDTVLFRRSVSTSVMLYKINNPTGSAHTPGTDEISNKFFIAVTNGDEVPDQILYSVGDFLGPKIIRFQAVKNDQYLLTIEYGVHKSRKRINLDISLDKVTVLK
ncbi:hypothetical protein FO440_10305 [Mucilaginibacter corticis]|uniref:Uncharacterized protein n=1 Tax=Mucilaginibacter corticis TaxID=2597670 RepID=A0A556MXC7_9SPHI|nr:hypothetical protein [Mucilaginibacter corticis]TSJ44542.1 hypothetical protein FO440_10305 [Mucilaginibacter corticis]